MIQLKVYATLSFAMLCGWLTQRTNQTVLNCIDNSGATVVECVGNLKNMKRHARIGPCPRKVICIKLKIADTIQAIAL